MANRSKDRRGRSRKRRPAAKASAAEGSAQAVGTAGQVDQVAPRDQQQPPTNGSRAERHPKDRRGARSTQASRPRTRRPRSSPTAPTYGERPQAPWHPLPLSELLILVGAIVAVIGLRRLDLKNPEISHGGTTLIAGIAAVAIGTIEVTLREHRSGYRSHTVMLALLPLLVLDSLVVLVVSAFTTAPHFLGIGLLALDVILFVFLFRLLRARFLDARHARVLKEG